MSKKKEDGREVLQKALLSAVTLGTSTLKEVWDDALKPQEAPDQQQLPEDLKQKEEIRREKLEKHLLGAATLGTSTLREVWEDMLHPPSAPDRGDSSGQRQSSEEAAKGR